MTDLKSKAYQIFYRLRSGEQKSLLMGAFVCSMIASGLHLMQNARSEAHLRETQKLVAIYVFDRDHPAGGLIEKDHLTTALIPEALLTTNMVEEGDADAIVRQRPVMDMKKGDPVLVTSLESVRGQSMTQKIPQGKRFIVLPVNDILVTKGHVKPNDRVDLLVEMDLPGRGATLFTLMRDITLVTVGAASIWSESSAGRAQDIGFFVSPNEEEMLKFAAQKARFSLSPRSQMENAKSEPSSPSNGYDMKRFLALPQVPKEVRAWRE